MSESESEALSKQMTRTMWDALDAAARAKVIADKVAIVDESAAERKQRASEARDKAIAEGGGKVILRELFNTFDAQARVDFFKQRGRVID